MKTKTTLAALLLAAVMVTPSYGATSAFLGGADAIANHGKGTSTYSAGVFSGYCIAAVDSGKVGFPIGAAYGQLIAVVVRYVDSHPEHHHLSNMELVKRACKEAWPDLNKHVFVSR